VSIFVVLVAIISAPTLMVVLVNQHIVLLLHILV
jgi:hypothetical protein